MIEKMSSRAPLRTKDANIDNAFFENAFAFIDPRGVPGSLCAPSDSLYFFSPGRVEASKVRDAGSRPQGQPRRVARKGKALVEKGLSIGRKLKSGASRQGARLKSVVRTLRNQRR